MKIIFAQGNPGIEYEKTRHNIGFLALDFFASAHGASFQTKSKFHADIAELNLQDEKVLLVKPTTFYNETGKAARTLVDFYKVDNKDILTIHDDLALPFGTIRTREKGSDAGNNGIKSLNAHLGQDYARIRVGIWNDLAERIDAADFVLSRFTANEANVLLDTVLPKTDELISAFIVDDFMTTSHKL